MNKYLMCLVLLFSLVAIPFFVSAQSLLMVDIKADDSNSPITVPYGTASMLSWTSSGASFCSGSRSGSGTWGGTISTSGAQGTGNLTGASTFTISCQSSNGTVVTDSVVVNVSNAAPTVDLKADDNNGPVTVPYGTASMLSWSSTNTSFCSGSRSGSSGTWGGTLAISGAQGTGNLTSSNTFTVSCQSPSGVVVTDSVMVNVASSSATPTVNLSADSTTHVGVYNEMLGWSSTNADSCIASGAWSGIKAISGAQSVGPITTTSKYTLTCTGQGGTASKSVIITVASSPTVNLTANGHDGYTTIPSGTAEMLEWTSTNTNSCSASGAWSGTKVTTGAESTGNLTTTTNTSSRTYLITCTGLGGSVSDTFTVYVSPAPQLSLKLITPNGGEKLTIGSTYEVKNTYDNQIQPMIGYALYKGNTKLGHLAGTPVVSDQNFKWNVGQYQEFNSNEVKTTATGSDYYIGLYTPGNSKLDFSDAPFEIISPTYTSHLTIMFPSQGSSLEIGKKYKIQWVGSGLDADNYSIYLVSSGSTGSLLLGKISASADSFEWIVPSTILVGSGYQLQLSSGNNLISNSQSFNIVNPTREVADVDTQPQSSGCLDLSNSLRYRSRDAQTNGEVSDLQDFLQTKGYLKSEPTGYFGLLTFQAAKDFQRDNNTSPTGFIGPITRAKIKALSCQ